MSVARHLDAVSLVSAMATLALITTPYLRPAHGAAMIVVNSLGDEDVNDANCSLREAIVAANTNASYNGCAAMGAGVNDRIVFDLGPDTPTINIGTTALPP